MFDGSEKVFEAGVTVRRDSEFFHPLHSCNVWVGSLREPSASSILASVRVDQQRLFQNRPPSGEGDLRRTSIEIKFLRGRLHIILHDKTR